MEIEHERIIWKDSLQEVTLRLRPMGLNGKEGVTPPRCYPALFIQTAANVNRIVN